MDERARRSPLISRRVRKEPMMFRFFETRVDPLEPRPDVMPPADLVGYYLFFTRPMKWWILGFMAAGLAVSLIEIATLRYAGALVDVLSHSDPAHVFRDRAWEFAGMAALVLIGRPLAALMQDLLHHQTIGPAMTNFVRWRTHRWVLRQSVSYFANEFAGRIGGNIVGSASAFVGSVTQSLDALWFVTIFAVSALVLFGAIDLRLVLPLIVWIAVYVLLLFHFIPIVRAGSEDLATKRAAMTGRMVDSYTNIQTVKLFAHTEREEEFAREAIVAHTRSYFRQSRSITLFNLCVSSSNGVFIVAIGALSIALWSVGTVTIGEIAVTIGLALRIVTMSTWLMWAAIGILDNVGQVQEAINTIAKPHLLTDRPNAGALVAASGAIAFDNVTFHYGRKGGVIEKLSLKIAPGEKVGLVGRSGAGKSTLVNLLLRFHDVEGGSIKIDGQNIAEARQDSLRQQIGVVTQDTSLLHRSIAENIRYGRPEASDEEVETVARQAHAHEFITGLTDRDGRSGYQTLVGERGVKLSGGQRQRIAIARVLLKNAPILVLDEATSALDSEVEAAIQESLDVLMRGKTVIAIAHRLSTIAAMDRLIVLEGGRIVEMGSHRELIEHDGVYAALWRRQSGGFLDV